MKAPNKAPVEEVETIDLPKKVINANTKDDVDTTSNVLNGVELSYEFLGGTPKKEMNYENKNSLGEENSRRIALFKRGHKIAEFMPGDNSLKKAA